VRATTLLNRVLDLPGISVSAVAWQGSRLVVDVRLRADRLGCPLCGFTTRAGYDTREVPSWWRSLDFGPHVVIVRALLRRLECPEHGVRIQAVPFARHRAGFTRDFEDVAAFLATETDKTTIVRFLRIDWDTVGRICERVVADGLDQDRLEGLVNIGVDEVSWKKRHFSGDPRLSPGVSSGGLWSGLRRTLCLLCATWPTVRPAGSGGVADEVIDPRWTRRACSTW
jgi:transposase